MAKEEKTKKVKTTKQTKESFASNVKQELKKVTWPSAKDIIKYTLATLVFCLLLAGFFSLLSLILSIIKGVFN